MAYDSTEIVSVEYLVDDNGSKFLVLKKNNGELVEFEGLNSFQLDELYVPVSEFVTAINTLTADLNEHIATQHAHPDLSTHLALGLDAAD